MESMLATLRERIQAYTDGGDPSGLLDERAVSDAQQLLQAAKSQAPDGSVPVEVISTVAWLYWCRYQVLLAAENYDDLLVAGPLFVTLFSTHPELVPEVLHSFIASQDPNTDYPDRWSGQAVGILRQLQAFDDPVALDHAVDLLRASLNATPADHPDRANRLSNLAGALGMRFERRGNPADADAAVQAGRDAVEATPPTSSNRATCLANLGAALSLRFERRADPADADAAVQAGRDAVEATPPTDPDRATRLANLSNALRARFGSSDDLADANEAVTTSRDAVAASAPDDPERAGHLGNLGTALGVRFSRVGDMADLNEAVQAVRDAVAAAAPGHPHRALYLSNLGGLLQLRLAHGGASDDDLDEAVQASRDAVKATALNHTDRGIHLTELGNALQARFERGGDTVDLDEAVHANRDAVEATPPGNPERATYLSNLGNALQARFDRGGDTVDLDEAVHANRDAVEATPPGHPDRPRNLINLGAALYRRFRHGEAVSDLDEAVQVSSDAVEATPPGHLDRASILSSLGGTLQTRFEHSGEPMDLAAAIRVGQEAVEDIPTGHPDRAGILCNLGGALETRFERSRDPGDADATIELLREAVAAGSAPAVERLRAARQWGRFAAGLQGDWASATAGYAAAVALLPLLVWRGIERGSRERLLANWTGLSSDAAACAIAAGQVDRAVELLEQGRTVLWSQLLETRTDLTALHEVAPDIAEQLNEVRSALDLPAGQPGTGARAAGGGAAARSAQIAQRMRLARRWDELVSQARNLPGFGSFLSPPSARELRDAAQGGTVVIVNVSRWRCDALVITPSATEVIALPDLSLDEVVARSNRYLRAVQNFERSDRGNIAQIVTEQAVTATLEWLWDAIAEPVLTGLGHLQTPQPGSPWPRLWWCPTGPLALLPVHAAGHHHPDRDPGRTVLDRAVSSYTPTLRILLGARHAGIRPDAGSDRLLLVSLPETPGQDPLPEARRERDLLVTLLREDRCTVLEGIHATRRNVRDAVTRHAWLHFSCHGDQNLSAPWNAGILLHDGMFTIGDVNADPRRGEFVFLSACKTAIGGIGVPDEAVTLAAALQFAGYRHVVGALWSIGDAAAADVTAEVYPRLTHRGYLDSTDTALALHQAVRKARAILPYAPSRWALVMHAGR